MALNEEQIAAIVERVVARIEGRIGEKKKEPLPLSSPSRGPLFATVDEAVEKATSAQRSFASLPLKKRREIIANIRERLRERVEELARDAVAETGLGRFEDKIKKNLLVIEKTPGVEVLETKAFSGEHGLTITERAPYGVLASITPSTNPSETVINNGIGMIAGGNGVVVNAHPMRGTGEPDNRHPRAHHRYRIGADEASGDKGAGSHRWRRGGEGGNELGKEGDRSRTGKPSGGGR